MLRLRIAGVTLASCLGITSAGLRVTGSSPPQNDTKKKSAKRCRNSTAPLFTPMPVRAAMKARSPSHLSRQSCAGSVETSSPAAFAATVSPT